MKREIKPSILTDMDISLLNSDQLMRILFDKVLENMAEAKNLMGENRLIEYCHLLTKTSNLVTYLKNHKNCNAANESKRSFMATIVLTTYQDLEYCLHMARTKQDKVFLDRAYETIELLRGQLENTSDNR